jgi:hypothetical protein
MLNKKQTASKISYKSDTPEFDEILKEYMSGIKHLYPGFTFRESAGCRPDYFELELAFNAQTIHGTEYELKEDNYLIHYTPSIQSVIEILYSGTLRLKNLVALNDPQELIYAINSLELKSFAAYTENFKSTYFSASFCKVEDYDEPDKFTMWRLYGDSGFGCAIVFEVEKHESNWHDFMLAQVQYGETGASNQLKSLFKFHDSFQESYNFPIKNIPITFPALLAFHKNEIWSDEKEIRLLSYHDYV